MNNEVSLRLEENLSHFYISVLHMNSVDLLTYYILYYL